MKKILRMWKKIQLSHDNYKKQSWSHGHNLTLALCCYPNVSPASADPVVFHLVLSPVVDGDFLPDDPAKLFPNAANIDYIAGINNCDGHMFTGLDVPSINQPLYHTDP